MRARVVNRISRALARRRQASNASQLGVAHDRHLIEIVHAGAAEGAVGGREARRLDDVRFDAEAGGKPQDGPGVLGDIGLKQRNPQGWGHACTRSGRLVL